MLLAKLETLASEANIDENYQYTPNQFTEIHNKFINADVERSVLADKMSSLILENSKLKEDFQSITKRNALIVKQLGTLFIINLIIL